MLSIASAETWLVWSVKIDVSAEKIFSEPGTYTANVFSDNSCVAKVSDFEGGAVTLEFSGEPGGTAIIMELRNDDLEDCRAIFVFFVDINFVYF